MKQLIFTLFFSLSTFMVWSQIEVTGTINDEAGEPLIGVSVTILGTDRGTITDFDGNYRISVPGAESVLEFSFLGFKTQEVVVGNNRVINIMLSEDVSKLDEVLVVGYGTQIKSQLTGNIARVGGEEIQNIPVPSLEEALQGRAAGVFIEANNGKPGGQNRMRVRGAASIGASNQPLFVVDGIPISVDALNATGAAVNPLTDINPNDIESVEILKDASAAAIYGSRATNGVVLITTKKGKAGATKLNFNLQTGWSGPTGRREFMNAAEYIDYFRHAAANSDALENDDFWSGFMEGRLRRYSGHAAIEDANGNYIGSEVDTDWQDEAFRTARSTMADLSASGGTDKLRYFASGSFNSQEGILVANGFQRLSARLNVDNKVNNWIDMGLQLSLARTSIDQVAADNAFSTPIQLVALAPITPVRDPDGFLYDRPTTTYYNGLLDAEDAIRDIKNFRTIANTYINFKLTSKLQWRNELGFDLFNMRENAFYGSRTQVGEAVGGLGTATYATTQNLLGKSYLTYDEQLGGGLKMNAVLGSEIQYSETDRANVEGRDFPLDDLKTLASAAEISGGTSTFTQFSFLSYFTRFNFSYQDKYLLTLSGRVDGSSRFGDNKRYGFFPAVSAGWVITNEDFFNVNTISFLKLRASFGSTGNAQIGNFDHLGLYGTGSYNNQPGLLPTQIPNPDLGWENTAQYDIGIDFGLFNDRLTGELDFYNKNTTDLLLSVPVPGTSGFATQRQNLGSVRNTGFEVVLNSNNLVGKFKWTTSFNFAFNRNEVTSLGEQTIIDGGSSRFMNVVLVGHPIGVFYGAEYAGVDPANGDAIWYINDPENPNRETTNNFSDANFVVLGNPTPEYIGGITNRFTFKGFDLSFTFQGVFGNQIHLAGDSFMAANAEWFDNQTRDQLNSWRQPGDITNIPQARFAYVNGNQGRNSRYLSPGSYLRLRNLNFGYEFPRNTLRAAGIDRLRVYIMGQNLLTFTDYIGWDPEVSTDFAVTNVTSGVEFYSAPQPRTITFGVNVGF
jgi:TonB-dependent starch-binding outer membrane protein SusC